MFGTPESASANSDLEWADSAVSFVYRNTSTGDLSLVVILDEVNDGTGGETDVVVTGSGFGGDGWLVEDDPGDDYTSDSGGPASASWAFNEHNTDGGAIDVDSSSFDLDVDADFTDFTDFDEWVLVHGDGTETTLTTVENPDSVTFRTN